MIGLPKSTDFNKRIPKQKFYENLNISPELKRVFIDQINNVYWRNKISVSTMNLAKGDIVTEIEVFEIKLAAPMLSESALRQMDKQIPYHILFLLEYDGKYQAWIGYKEAAAGGNNAFKVNVYYHTDWMSKSELPLKPLGLSLDDVYENFVKQIHSDNRWQDERSLAENVAKEQEIEKLNKKIAALQKKMRTEKQLNKQVALREEIKRLKQEMEKV